MCMGWFQFGEYCTGGSSLHSNYGVGCGGYLLVGMWVSEWCGTRVGNNSCFWCWVLGPYIWVGSGLLGVNILPREFTINL